MKMWVRLIIITILFGGLCVGLLIGCDDDSNKKPQRISNAILENDPTLGFLLNSTPYILSIDLGEVETFTINLVPGQLYGLRLNTNRTYVIHVVVLNDRGRAVSEYVNSFYVDDVPLDNQLADAICSWFIEFTSNYPEYGFANRFGS